MFITKYIGAFLGAFVVAYLLTPLVRRAAMALGMMDLPDERRIHRTPTPRGGGLAIVIGFHVAYLAAMGLGWTQYARGLGIDWWYWFLPASLILVAVGLVDDYSPLPPLVKLAGQVAAAALMFTGGCRFGVLVGFDLPLWVDFGVTLLWFLGITNAFNLIDGLDGLATGLALITVLGLAGALLFRRMSGDAMVLLMLAGACAAFLRYNFHPASIFLGDTGSLFLGFALASLSLSTQSKGTFMAAVGVPLLAMGVPLFDTMLAIWRRSLRMVVHRAFPGQVRPAGVMQADAEHLHHRFLRLGLKQHQVAIALYLINGALVLVGLLSLVFRAQATGIFILAFLVATYLVFRHLAKVELWDTGRAIVYGLRRPAGRQVAHAAYLILDVCSLGAALVLAALLTDYPASVQYTRSELIHMIPYWISPVFVAMAAGNIYNRVWSRAQVCDYLYLTVAVIAGVLTSLALVAMLGDGLTRGLITFAVIYGGIAHFLVSMLRIAFRGTREVLNRLYHSEAFGPPDSDEERVLLVGAGGRCMLFLREIGFDLFDRSLRRRVVGLIDDDPNLRRRVVYGYRILGNREDLPRLIKAHRIHQLIITAILTDDVREAVAETARTSGVSLTEWRYGETVLVPPGPRLAHLREEEVPSAAQPLSAGET